MHDKQMIDNPDFRTQVYQAAERTNKRYGEWMPQQWLEIFIGEMMVGDQAGDKDISRKPKE